MAYYNENVLSRLPDGNKTESLEAVLYTDKAVYPCFVSNPLGFNVSNSLNISTVNLPGFNGNKHTFNNTNSREISLPGIIFDTFALNKGLQIIIDEIESLMIPGENGEYTYIGFRWGLTDFYPCFLTEFSYDVEFLINGDPAKLSASISLVETSNLSSEEIAENLENVSTELAEFEKIEALEIAQNDARENNQLLGENLYDRLLEGDINLEIDSTGLISYTDTILKRVEEIAQFDPINFAVNWFSK